VAWFAAQLRPDRFPTVIALSVPYRARGAVRPTSVMPQTDEAIWYQLYFQEPGIAEAEYDRNVRAVFHAGRIGISGDAPPGTRPFLASAPGDISLLKPGTAVFVIALKKPDGTITSARLYAEKDGVKPPM